MGTVGGWEGRAAGAVAMLVVGAGGCTTVLGDFTTSQGSVDAGATPDDGQASTFPTIHGDAGSDAATNDSGDATRPPAVDAGDAGDSGAADATDADVGVDAEDVADAHGGADALHDAGVVDAADAANLLDAEGPSDATLSETGPACDPTATPATSPCAISETYGLFVAPSANGGSDTTGTGTRAAPFATLGTAIPKAVVANRRVYVCGGATYAEAVTIGATTDGVSIYGGLACPAAPGTGAWSYSGAAATVAPASPGNALSVSGLAKGAHFEDMAFVAQAASASTAGASSIAVLVNASIGVSFLRVAATAGNGSPGAAPSLPSSNWCTPTTQSGAGGTNGSSPPVNPVPGGAGGICNCPFFGTSMGGAGAQGNVDPVAGSDGIATPETPGVPPFDGTGGVENVGDDGSNGAAGVPGSAGSQGSLGASGWMPAIAGTGAEGFPGEGGGGGASIGEFETHFIGGGGGGAGGCGGNGGAGGGGGGASFAFAIVDSTVTMSAVTLHAASGGAGGAGAAGQAGQGGGIGAGTSNDAFGGGTGGQGAGGSGGGGGAGGPSVGIAWTGGTGPTVDGVSPPAATLTAPSSFAGASSALGGLGGAAGAASTGQVDSVGNPLPSGNAGNAGLMGADGIQGAVQQF